VYSSLPVLPAPWLETRSHVQQEGHGSNSR
jgi:hypothetical protein